MEKKEIEKVKKEIEKINKECDEQNQLTDKIIIKILGLTCEDWYAGVVENNGDKLMIHKDTVSAIEKKFNIDGFLSELNKEQMEIFIHLLLLETKHFFNVFDLEELKKIKLD